MKLHNKQRCEICHRLFWHKYKCKSQQVTGSSNTPRAEVISKKLPNALLIPADNIIKNSPEVKR